MTRSRSDRAWDSPLVRDRAGPFREAVERHDCTNLAHVTEAENVPSILRTGILSRRLRRVRQINVVSHGYGTISKVADFENHCATSLEIPHVGMKFKMANPAYLYIEPAIIATPGTFFVPGNTASSRWTFEEATSRSTVHDFDGLFLSSDSAALRDWQSEIWVRDGIPESFLIAVVFQDQATRDRVASEAASALAELFWPPDLIVF